jgi:hypothetical protein
MILAVAPVRDGEVKLPPELMMRSPITVRSVALVFNATSTPSIVRLLQTSPVVSIVIVTPAGITTSSEDVGT